MTTTHLLETLAVAAVLVALPARAAPGGASAPRQNRLEQFIAQVRNAETPVAAASAYARRRVLQADSIPLLEAYARRMLRFGLVEIAYEPARRLTRLRPDSGLPWAVVGYMQAQRGQAAEADRPRRGTLRTPARTRFVVARAPRLPTGWSCPWVAGTPLPRPEWIESPAGRPWNAWARRPRHVLTHVPRGSPQPGQPVPSPQLLWSERRIARTMVMARLRGAIQGSER